MIDRQPPGHTTRVDATRVLVLAPHPDDEVLGCGGLLRQLADGGARIEVLFVTDGEASCPPGEDAVVHARQRAQEGERAAQVLGVGTVSHLGLPDGRLEHHVAKLAAALVERLLAAAPDLLLVPSPLEGSRDHQAVFAGLHAALAPLRDEDRARPTEAPERRLLEVAQGLRVLAYEVNRPLYPSLLVDTTAQVPTLRAAMACHASQEAQHRYLEARLGLSRWRALSLPPSVEAAEAFAELGAQDFATRSPAQLVAHLGGTPAVFEVHDGPLVSVVVRTLDRPALLAEALASLAAGHYRRVEVVLVNDGGAPPPVPAELPLPLRRVDLPETRGRALAAQAGVEAATGSHVAFLDDDDLAAPEHLATLAGLVGGAGVRVAYTDAAVGVYELAPSGWHCVERRLPYSRDFDAELLRLDNYIPFNTLLIERSLFAEVGPFDAELPFFEDWDLLVRLAARTPFHHLRRVTCEYRHFRGAGHHILGAEAQARPDFVAMKARVFAKHQAWLEPTRLARAVDRLRAELVALGEERSSQQQELARREAERLALLRERGEAELAYHRAHGEAASLATELTEHRRVVAELTGEIERRFVHEGRLRQDLVTQTERVAEQQGEAGRLYAEIERLNTLIRTMEGTRAWRLHQRLQAFRAHGRSQP
jgi:LmbE family N-acetylglucosaminyl deacetylase